MKIQPFQTVGQIALILPEAVLIFDKYKIDYFSQGNHSLSDACYLAGVHLSDILAELESAWAGQGKWYEAEPDWESAPMAEVVDHILKVHHDYVYKQLELIEKLLAADAETGESHHPEVTFLHSFFPDMVRDLRDHMREEEEVVFPYLLDAERAMERGLPIPHPFHGYSSATHPILTLQADHGMMGREWKKLEELTHHFTPGPGASRILKDLYRALKELEMDNRKHMHLENNVLFHRAEQLGLVNGEHMSHQH